MRGRIRTVVVLASATVVVAGGIATAVVAGAATAPTLLSQGKPVTASSSDPKFPAANAVDGSLTNRWASVANTDPSWIYVDLGSTATISEVKLTWDKSCAVAYSVETSADHSKWTSISSTTKGDGGVDDLTVTGSGRYVRVNGTKRCRADATHGYSLDEFQVFGTTGGGGGDKTPPTAPGKPVAGTIASDSVALTWAASTDNVKVTSYEIDANGSAAGTATGTSGSATGLAPDTDYKITIVALDAAGNRSDPSPATTVHTAKGTGGPNPFNDPHLVSMFNGTSLTGWTQATAGEWTAQNGVIHGNGTGRGWLYYNTNTGSTFRWIFDVRHLPTTKGKDHAPTVLIWGTASPLRDALSAIQFQPPNGGHWDYRPGKNTGGGSEFKQFTHTKIDNKNWAQCELIGNMSTGVARMACCPLSSASNSVTCKGVEVLDFMDKTAGRVGLLALQVHNAGLHDEYKNLWFESPVVQSPGQFITT